MTLPTPKLELVRHRVQRSERTTIDSVNYCREPGIKTMKGKLITTPLTVSRSESIDPCAAGNGTTNSLLRLFQSRSPCWEPQN